MRKLATLTAVTALAAFVFAGPASAAPVVENLTADNGDGVSGFNAGTVTVTDLGSTITVTFDRTGTFLIAETHAHLELAADCALIPQNKNGNPKVGKFDEQSAFTLPGSIQVVLTFQDNFAPASNLCIAAHAVIYDDAGGLTDQQKFDATEETAWGDGDDGVQFTVGRNWATIFTSFTTD